jgi:hypothetical protein
MYTLWTPAKASVNDGQDAHETSRSVRPRDLSFLPLARTRPLARRTARHSSWAQACLDELTDAIDLLLSSKPLVLRGRPSRRLFVSRYRENMMRSIFVLCSLWAFSFGAVHAQTVERIDITELRIYTADTKQILQAPSRSPELPNMSPPQAYDR